MGDAGKIFLWSAILFFGRCNICLRHPEWLHSIEIPPRGLDANVH
jgi:hypothetical protein